MEFQSRKPRVCLLVECPLQEVSGFTGPGKGINPEVEQSRLLSLPKYLFYGRDVREAVSAGDCMLKSVFLRCKA